MNFNKLWPKPAKADTAEVHSAPGILDVVWLSLKLSFTRIQRWLPVNLLFLLYSLPILTGPTAKTAMFSTVAQLLRDPGDSRTEINESMKTAFKLHRARPFLVVLIKWVVFLLIVLSIWFWVNRESLVMRLVTILPIYALVLWASTISFIYPIMVQNPQMTALQVSRNAFLLAFTHPFSSLLIALVGIILTALGLIMLGPILLIIPVMRAILMTHAYWFLTGEPIAGFIETSTYIQMMHSEDNSEVNDEL